jgi:hypothetical protein
MRCDGCNHDCGHPNPNKTDREGLRTARSYAWCRLCNAQFIGHARCEVKVRELRDIHERSCVRVVIPRREVIACE